MSVEVQHCVLMDVCVCENKADGRGSLPLQTRPLHGRVTAQEIQGYKLGPIPESESCEVIGWILLHRVTIVLHRLIGEALVGKDSD